MLLRPRRFTYKGRHKDRDRPVTPRVTGLVFGDHGLQLLQPLNIVSKRLFKLKIFMKKGSRRVDKTGRRLWLNAFPHLPLTKKVIGSRMGKGKGKLKDWFSHTSPGINLFEYRNLRSGRAVYFLRQLSFRLPVRTRIINQYRNKKVYLPVSPRVSINFQSLI